MRPYADRMLELMAGTARASASVRGLPLLQQHEQEQSGRDRPAERRPRPRRRRSTRRSCAARWRCSRELQGEGKQVRWVGVGRRGVGSLRFRRFELVGEFTGFTDEPRYADAQAIAHRVAELYTEEEVDRVVVVYNALRVRARRSGSRCRTSCRSRGDLLETSDEEREEDALRGDFIFEPEPEQILERLLPVYLETEIYRALLESAASEHGARMTAMRNASKNAGELIDSLTLAMNRARQAEITQEILEVVAGADALTT